MIQKEEILIELNKLISKDEFTNQIKHSSQIWTVDPEVFDFIFSRMNLCTVQLVKAIEQDSSSWQLKRILRINLEKFRRSDFDTEDAEFVTNCFGLLAAIINVKFGDNLMRWLYGPIIWLMMKIGHFIRPDKILATKTQDCSNCSTKLIINLKRTGSGRISDWIIGRCMNCNEYNLMDSFDNAKLTSFSNFSPEENLAKDEFTEEQAKIRLEQVKYYRK